MRINNQQFFRRVLCQVRALMSKDVEVKAHIMWICVTPKPWGNISPFDFVIFSAVQQIATSSFRKSRIFLPCGVLPHKK